MITLEIPQTEEENRLLGLWLQQRVPDFQIDNFQAMAFFEKDVGIHAVVAFHNYRETDMQIAFAAEPGGKWAQRGLITAVLNYPFSVGCNRLTAVTRRSYKKTRKMLHQLGFKEEGVLRRGAADGTDLILYGLLPEDYKFARKSTLKRAA